MQYLKALVMVVFFFLAMVFLCQNQGPLSSEVTLQLNLLLLPTDNAPSVTLDFYLVVIAAFLLGAICCFLILLWDRVRMSARAMRAQWRVRTLQSEQLQMVGQIRQLVEAPVEARPALYAKFKSLYEDHKKEREEERRKGDNIDIKQLTIDATASTTPSK